MFSWFKPKCPLETAQQVWVETRMNWLVQEFGLEPAWRAKVALPNAEFLPQNWNGTQDDIQDLVERICRFLPVDPRRVRVQVCADVDMGDALGLYHQEEHGCLIQVRDSLLRDVVHLTYVLSHELAHEVLLGQGHLDTAVSDHEWVTDLLPLYFGLGIFHANTVIAENSYSDGQYSYWSAQRSGYLTARLYGYALAIFAKIRGDSRPVWMSELRLDAADTMRRGLLYLKSAKDSLFQTCAILGKGAIKPVEEIHAQLRSKFATFRLAGILDLKTQTEKLTTEIPQVIKLLRDRNPAIRVAAAEVLTSFGPLASAAVPDLLDRLKDYVSQMRVESAKALAAIHAEPNVVVPELCVTLRSTDRALVRAVAKSLEAFCNDAEPPIKPLVDALLKADRECDFELLDSLVRCLRKVPNIHQRIDEVFATSDDEFCKSITNLIDQGSDEEITNREA